MKATIVPLRKVFITVIQKPIVWLVILFAFLFGFVSIAKHNHFQTFGWDLAFFDELIWKVSQGIEPRSSFNNLHILGDHFQPIILLFAPLYWIKNDVRLLLIAHAVIAAVSTLPVYLLARKILKHRFLSLSVCLSFLLFTKEEYALLVVAIGISIVFYYKRLCLGVTTITMGALSFFIIIYLIIPYFQKGPYSHFEYGELGRTPQEIMLTSITRPERLIQLVFTPPIKINTMFATFLSFGFLPLLSLWHILPI